MSSIQMICNDGCNQQFAIHQFQHVMLNDGVEKTCFICTHCEHEYVAFYTDDEIRNLQARIRLVQKRFADPNDNHEEATKEEAVIKAEIKEKVDALKKRYEGEMK